MAFGSFPGIGWDSIDITRRKAASRALSIRFDGARRDYRRYSVGVIGALIETSSGELG
jgi:hypothetical protein